MDPLLFGIATNLATDVLKAAYLHSRDIGLGDAETRALRRAFTRAFGVLATDVAQARQDELTPDLVTLVEGQLRRLVTDAAIAEMLLAAALEERGPDPARLRERFEELGFDPQTFLTDFDTAMSRFRYALADELLQEAGTARSPLFNRVVLAQLAAVRDQLAHLAGRPGADEPRTPAGRPIREWTDPFALEVHPAINAGADPADVLPQYVRREHDAELGRIVASAMDGRSVIRVLVGGSSTGKTRACWEALRLLPDTWRLWHPLSPGRSEALLGGFAAVGPRTVLWLNDLHDYLLHDPAAGERVAAGLRELLRDPDRGPVLILGTTWPEYWARLTVPPPPGPSDPHAQARSLLTGTDLVVPESFAESDREGAAEAAWSDARLREALEHARDGEVAQYLAGGPALLERYRTAPPAAKAVVEAAMDARRLGHGPNLSRVLLRRAAPGYLTDRQREGLAEDWFEKALAYTGAPCRGVPGPVAGRPMDASLPVYGLADYLDQWARRARAAVLVPASTWDALREHGAEQDLPAIAQEADRRHLYRRAVALYEPAAEAGDVDALLVSAHHLAVVGEVDQALMLYERAADAGFSLALEYAAQALADLGLVDASLTWWRMAADAGDHAHYAGIRAARSLARAGRLDEALEWWERAANPDDDDLVWYNSTLRFRCWVDHRIPLGILDFTTHLPFGNTGAQLALLDAGRALHRAGRLAEALRWYERAADVERSQVVTWYKRRDPASKEVHDEARWLAERLDRRSKRTVTDPADVFYEVAWKGRSLAVVHGAQALAETGDTAETLRWLFDHLHDDGEVVTVAAKIFHMVGRAEQAIEWIQHDDSDLAARVRARSWAHAFGEARRKIYRSGHLDWTGVVDNTYGAEIFDVLEPRGAPYADGIHLAGHQGLDLADLYRKVACGDVDALAAIALRHREAGRTEEAVKAYLHSAECGKDGFSEAVDLLRQAGREDEAERLARFGLEPGGVIGHHPMGDLEPPPVQTDETEELVGVLLRRWRRSGNVFGDAVLRAAVDILRCGFRRLLPAELLGAVASVLLADLGIPPMGPERLRAALAWAGEPVADGVAALRRHDDGYQLLRPLLNAIVADPDYPPVPEAVWRAVAEHAAPEECWSIAKAAHEAELTEIAESAGRRGAEHGDGLGMYVLSNVLRAAGRDDEAARWLNSAAEAGDSDALRTIADDAAAQGRIEEAIARYRQVGDWAAGIQLGALLYREGRLAEAEEAFREALPDGPPLVAHNLGVVLRALGRPAEAEPYFAQAAASGYAPARADHARVLLQLSQPDKAGMCYLSAISSGAIELAAEYGEFLERQGRGGEALRLANRLAEQGKTALLADLFRQGADAGDDYCKNRLAILLAERGDLGQAERLYREAIAGGFLPARNNLALLLQQRGDHEAAEELLRAAAADGDVNATNNLGALLHGQRRHDEAEPFLLQAMAAGDVGAVNNLGLLQQTRGHRAEAERLFRLAAEAGNRQAPGNLAQLLSEGQPAPTTGVAEP
ncbi:tetratricopeptide repeat protein [Micromonospora sp. CMU55-4]|uniref:tetratricopeptide repeat protein n=1 Tax=Micromonospora sp. CMU55-4 TaxID=2717028 RepID=UPI001409F965|nr:tetratricopeptide repeat protein [Micromonospora sp. CMU55-4]NHO82136.1 tetratricopeptide repeat protein [Micromonospora sp. CMU55-4]